MRKADCVALASAALLHAASADFAEGDIYDDADYVAEVAAVASWNADRKAAHQGMTALIYTLIGLAMICVVAVVSSWQAWLVGGMKVFCDGPLANNPVGQFWAKFFCSPARRYCWWLAVFLALIETISWFGGIGGWVVIGSFLVFHAGVIFVVYVFCVLKKGGGSKVAPAPGEEEALDEKAAEPASAVERPEWTHFPQLVGKTQKKIILFNFMGIVVFTAVAMIAGLAWVPIQYQIWDRRNGQAIEEYMPSVTGKTIAMMYAHDGLGRTLEFNLYAKMLTNWCGEHYTRELTAAEKETKINEDFIEAYKIDMSQYEPEDYSEYDSVNGWFVRNLAPGARPIADADNDDVCVSPADARLMVFPNAETDHDIWVKGEHFTLLKLLNDRQDLADLFEGGAMLVVRLAPQDYHRFHAPVAGTLKSFEPVETKQYLSVNADSGTAANYAFYNERKLAVIDSPEFGDVAFIAIGATCVGSVLFTKEEGDGFAKGEELGFMQFGGSTVILLFKAGAIDIDNDLVYRSGQVVESYIQMGESLGVASA